MHYYFDSLSGSMYKKIFFSRNITFFLPTQKNTVRARDWTTHSLTNYHPIHLRNIHNFSLPLFLRFTLHSSQNTTPPSKPNTPTAKNMWLTHKFTSKHFKPPNQNKPSPQPPSQTEPFSTQSPIRHPPKLKENFTKHCIPISITDTIKVYHSHQHTSALRTQNPTNTWHIQLFNQAKGATETNHGEGWGKPLPSQQTKLPYGNINHVSIPKMYQTLTNAKNHVRTCKP